MRDLDIYSWFTAEIFNRILAANSEKLMGGRTSPFAHLNELIRILITRALI